METVNAAFSMALAGLVSAAATLDLALVLAVYRHEGRRFHLRVAWRDPARSLLYFNVWLGLWTLDLALRFAGICLDVLSEASADVGEWCLRRLPAHRRLY